MLKMMTLKFQIFGDDKYDGPTDSWLIFLKNHPDLQYWTQVEKYFKKKYSSRIKLSATNRYIYFDDESIMTEFLLTEF